MNPSNPNPYGLERPPFPPNPAPYEVPPIAPPVAVPAPPVAVDPRAKTAAIALFVACAAMLVGLASYGWFKSPDGDGGIGLLGLERCRKFGCQTMTWFDVPRAPGELQMFSAIGVLGIAAAVGFLIHTGVMLLRNRPKKVLLTWVNVTLGLAAFGTMSFLFRLGTGDLSKELKWGWAGFAALAGIVTAGIVVPAIVRPMAKKAGS